MLCDRYDAMSLPALFPSSGLRADAELALLDQLLDDDILFQRVRSDLVHRHPKTPTHGRHSTPVEVILRMLLVKRLYGWSYEQTERFVSDSLVLRQFCRVYLESVPDDTTLIRWANLIGPETVQELNDRVVELARKLKVTRGRKLRLDSTAIETNIHHPSDSRILSDGVRVLSRLLRRAKENVGETLGLSKVVFRSRVRTVRRLAQQFHRTARHKGEEAAEEMKVAYAKLIDVARATRHQSERVLVALKGKADDYATGLIESLDHFVPLVDQAIVQAEQRVLLGQTVPSNEKLLSLFEPHSEVVQRYKQGKRVEFGRKLWLEEVEGGIVSGYRLVEGGGQDYHYVPESLAQHKRLFGRAPRLLAADRGAYTLENEALAKREGVVHVAIPFGNKASPERRRQEHTRWFRRGYRFRAGIEGRIHVLKRDYGLQRCLDHGEDGMGRWVGWGILAHNLSKIAETVANRQASQKKVVA